MIDWVETKCSVRQIITIMCVVYEQIQTLIKQLLTKYQIFTKLPQIYNFYKTVIFKYNTNFFRPTAHHHSTNSYEPIRFLQTSQNRLINIHRKSLKHIRQSALFGCDKNIGHDQIWYENSVVFKAVQWLFMIKDRRPC